MSPKDELPCNHCKARGERNLILAFDGTSNQFGKHNTNVVELYAQITKDDNQLKYYNSGIGTYARPSFTSFKYWKQVLDNKIDLAIAWNFEKVLLGGYRWLSDKYQPGDKIFLFGFSRGAYQVRALAGMIKEIGLILPGNEEQIPFAYELYAELKSDSSNTGDCNRFKNAFSRTDVRIHFLGAWDTVSSVGIIRRKSLRHTDSFNNTICHFRHALALDERRIKFLPEYICGGSSRRFATKNPRSGDKDGQHDKNDDVADSKEVWFAGSHSDIGGGHKENTKLNSASIPLVWMRNEASTAGLRFDVSSLTWNWKHIEDMRPSNSLSKRWRFLEIMPFKRLSYTKDGYTWKPHLAQGRIIKQGQRIHASVPFIQGNYQPWALLPDDHEYTRITWKEITQQGVKNDIGWVDNLKNILELDIFDIWQGKIIIQELKLQIDPNDDPNNKLDKLLIGRLNFIASYRMFDFMAADAQGVQEIVDNAGIGLIREMLTSDSADVQSAGAETLLNLVTHVLDTHADDISCLLIRIVKSEHPQVQIYGPRAMAKEEVFKHMRDKLIDNKVHILLPRMSFQSSADDKVQREAIEQFIRNCENITMLVREVLI